MFQRIRNLFQRKRLDRDEDNRDENPQDEVRGEDEARLVWLGPGNILVIGGKGPDPDFVPPPSVYIPPKETPHSEDNEKEETGEDWTSADKNLVLKLIRQRKRLDKLEKELEELRKASSEELSSLNVLELDRVYRLLQKNRVSEAKILATRLLKNEHA